MVWSSICNTCIGSHWLNEIRRSHICSWHSMERSTWTKSCSKHRVLEAICWEKRHSISTNLTWSQSTILESDLGFLVVRKLLCLDPLLLVNCLQRQVDQRCFFGYALMLKWMRVHSNLVVWLDGVFTNRDQINWVFNHVCYVISTLLICVIFIVPLTRLINLLRYFLHFWSYWLFHLRCSSFIIVSAESLLGLLIFLNSFWLLNLKFCLISCFRIRFVLLVSVLIFLNHCCSQTATHKDIFIGIWYL